MAKEKKLKPVFKMKVIDKKKYGKVGVYVIDLEEKVGKKGLHKDGKYRLIRVFANAASPANAASDALDLIRKLETAMGLLPADVR